VRIERTRVDRLDALESHVRLLHSYAQRAFDEGDSDYFGEVAAKLRLLVGEHGNPPLLLNLMHEIGQSVTITLFMRNLLTRVPKAAQGFVATMVRTIFAQLDADTVREQHARVLAQLEGRFPEAAALLEEAGPEILAFTCQPKEHWRQLWSNNSLERLNKEIRRRTDVVGIFPDRASIVRLVGALLAEQNDEWAVARRYMSAESIAKALTDPVPETEEVMSIPAAA
jgi:transposase-like protein